MLQYTQDTKYVAETISILIDFSDMLSAGDTFEKECFLGIIEQDGSAISPIISFYYTSRPYPIEYAEIIQSSISPNYFHLLLNPRWTEIIQSTTSPQYINIDIGRIFYNNYPPELLQSTISPQSGLLIGALITYNNPHEDIKVSIAPLSGLLPVVRIFYLNYIPEQIKSSIAPQSGTLI